MLPDLSCSCDPGWRSPDCGELDLAPVANISGCYEHQVVLSDCGKPEGCGTSSWGGLPLYSDQDGLYHLFASQFVQNCTLKGWNPGSTVIRATSPNALGPFVYEETIFGTFHHNPTVRKLTPRQSGKGKDMYLMVMIGDDAPPPPASGGDCVYDQASDPHHLEGYITQAWSTSLLGPWTKSKTQLFPPGLTTEWDSTVTNPAPFFLDDGTAYVFYRGTQWPVSGEERIGLVKATRWDSAYARVGDSPIWGPFDDESAFVEDPFVWADARGVKMLSHGHWDEAGYYAFAEHVEGPWHFRKDPAYTNVLDMEDGTRTTLVQRERPQLLFDGKGKPVVLYTGVAPPGSDFYGFTYTHAQQVGGGSS